MTEQVSKKSFPVLFSSSDRLELERLGCPKFIRWDALNDGWAYQNHDQTLKRLAERGGLDPTEIVANIEKRQWHDMPLEDAVAIIKKARAVHWFIRVKQSEQLVLNVLRLRPDGALATDLVFDSASADQVSDALHSLKMRGLLERSDVGLWQVKKTNGNGAHVPAPVTIERETTMTKTSAPAQSKKCPRCQETKPLTSDGKANFYSNGYCVPCGRAKAKERSDAKPKAAGASARVGKKLASKRVAKYQHGIVPDPLGRMVVNLFSIRIRDHAGLDHDLVLDYATVKQLLIELKDCTS